MDAKKEQDGYKEEAANSVILAASHANTSRTNGYGDLCFHRPKYRSYPPCPQDFNAQFIELDAFQRSGSFPFFKLPLEIRLRIYRILCMRFYDNDFLVSMSIFRVSPHELGYPPWFDLVETTFYEQMGPIFEVAAKDVIQMVGIDVPTNFIKYSPVPVDRRYPYRMGIDTGCSSLNGFKSDWSMLSLVRNISNTSAQMRDEFGSVFWDRVDLSISDFDMDVSKLLLGFLLERPAVLPGLKAMSVEISFSFFRQDTEESQGSFAALGSFLAHSRVKLEKLKIAIFVPVHLLDSIEDHLESRGLSQLFRQFHVTREFDLRLDVNIDEEIYSSFWKTSQTRIYDALLPDTLRPDKSVPQMVEKDKYLLDRAKLIASKK